MEDLSAAGTSLLLKATYASWIKGVRQPTGAPSFAQLVPDVTANCLIANNYLTQPLTHSSETIGGNTTGFDLILNNIFQTEAGFVEGAGGADVWAYNLWRDGYNDPGQYFVNNTQSNHSAGYAMNLIEGNEMGNWQEDNVHGTANLNTFFRNIFYGNDPPYQDTDNAFAIAWEGVARFENGIGNVMGNPVNFLAYKCTSSSCPPGSIVTVGNGNTGITDALSNTTAMLWGNYDTVTAAVRWCGNSGNTGWATTCSSTSEIPTTLTGAAVPYQNAVPGSQTLPASFFLNAQPSWWTVCTNYPTCSSTQTPPWPPDPGPRKM